MRTNAHQDFLRSNKQKGGHCNAFFLSSKNLFAYFLSKVDSEKKWYSRVLLEGWGLEVSR